MRPVLYVVAKAPIMGRAKTRLAADIGPAHAQTYLPFAYGTGAQASSGSALGYCFGRDAAAFTRADA